MLPKATIGLTLLDVLTILNLSIHGEDLLSLYGICCVPSTTLGIKFSKDDSRYSKFMLLATKKSDIVSPGEHHAFLLMWFCRYFICTGLVGVVSEYCNFVSAITSDHDLALGPLHLSTLYMGIFHLLNNLEDCWIEYNIVFVQFSS